MRLVMIMGVPIFIARGMIGPSNIPGISLNCLVLIMRPYEKNKGVKYIGNLVNIKHENLKSFWISHYFPAIFKNL